MKRTGVAAALVFLEWRQLVNNVRGIAQAPRRLVVYIIFLLFAVRFFVFAPDASGGPVQLPLRLTIWLPMLTGLALLLPWAVPSPSALFASPADRTFLVGVRGQPRPLVARHLYHRYVNALRSMLGLVVLIMVFSRSGGVLGAAVWLVPIAVVYLTAARLAAGALQARRVPVAGLAVAAAMGWLALTVAPRWPLGMRSAVGAWPLAAALVHGDVWPTVLAWLALTGAVAVMGVLWAVPPSTDDWRLVDRWALVDAVRAGSSDRRELFRRQMVARLSRGRGGARPSHQFRWSGPGAVVEMEALTTLRQMIQAPWMTVLLVAAALVGGVLLAHGGRSAVVMWLLAMAYTGVVFTSVQSRLVGSHPIARDPLVIGAPGSSFVHVLAEEATGWAAGVLFWGGAVLVALVLGLAARWGVGALLLVAAGQAMVQSLRLLYWTLFPTLFERQVLGRLVSLVAAGALIGIPAVPLLALPWAVGVPTTAGLALAEAALLSWWAAHRLEWGRGPVPALGQEH